MEDLPTSSFGSGSWGCQRKSPLSRGHSRSMSDTMFESPLNAREIHDAYFSVPTAPVAKRNAIIDGDDSDRASRLSGSLPDAPVSPEPDHLSEWRVRNSLKPHPLNACLDSSLTEEELQDKKVKATEQQARLTKGLKGTANHATTMHQTETRPFAIVMVGLPGQGKTYMARRMMRYMSWMGVTVKMFNVGIYRRKHLKYPPAEFFDHTNTESAAQLQAMFELALKDMVDFLNESKKAMFRAAVFDGTNHTVERRMRIRQQLSSVCEPDRILFVEIQQSQDSLQAAVCEGMPEYAGREPQDAELDFQRRIDYYTKAYEPLEKKEGVSFIRYTGQKMHVHGVRGYLPRHLSFLLMNMKVKRRNIYLTTIAEQETDSGSEASGCTTPNNKQIVDDAIIKEAKKNSPTGSPVENLHRALSESVRLREALQKCKQSFTGAPPAVSKSPLLSPAGNDFALALKQLVTSTVPPGEEVTIWASNDLESQATTRALVDAGYPIVYWRYLGKFGFSVVQKVVEETYEDIIERLEPIIFEIERCDTHLVICGHQKVMTALQTYIAEVEADTMHAHNVVLVQPTAYRTHRELYCLNEEGEIQRILAPDFMDS